jgi:hypothetical protein
MFGSLEFAKPCMGLKAANRHFMNPARRRGGFRAERQCEFHPA